jgi:uncharacterized membrane protein
MGNNQDYKNRALASLEGKWSKAVVATLIYFVVSMGIDWVMTTPMGNNVALSYSTSGIWTLICLPFGWAFTVYFLRLIRDESLDYGHLLDGYKDFLRVFLAEFLISLAVVIGCLLLIIPGIIFAMMFAQTEFILKDDKEISAIDAMAKSISMMNGHKTELFALSLSFLGWAILSLLTLGIGFILLVPYFNTAMAHYYEDLKAEQGVANEVIA